jgi:hypothetical protein
MKRIFLYIVAALFFNISCNNEKDRSIDSIEDAVIDSIRDVNESDRTNNVANKPFHLDSLNSPAGLVIVFLGPSDIEGEYYFFSDGKIVNRYYQESAKVGNWRMVGSMINVVYYKRYFRNGIGDPLPLDGAVPGNYVDRFEKYEYLSEYLNETEELDWAEIKADIGTSSNFYELKSYRLVDQMFDTIIDLERN